MSKKEELLRLKEENATLRAKAKGLLAERNTLKRQNEKIREANHQLTAEIERLEKELQAAKEADKPSNDIAAAQQEHFKADRQEVTQSYFAAERAGLLGDREDRHE